MATYYVDSAATGANNGTSWTDAYTTLSGALTAVTEVAGDIFKISHLHTETISAIKPTALVYLVSCDKSASDAPTFGALFTITPTANNQYIEINGFLHAYGIEFKTLPHAFLGCGVRIGRDGTAHTGYYAKCKFSIDKGAGSNNCRLQLGTDGSPNIRLKITLESCTVIGVGGTINVSVGQSDILINNLTVSSIAQFTSLGNSNNSGTLIVSSSDLSSMTNLIAVNTIDSPRNWKFINCLVPTTIDGGTLVTTGGSGYELMGCGSPTNDFAYGYRKFNGCGVVTQDTGVYLTTGGASFANTNEGSNVPMSLKLVSSTGAVKSFPLETPWFNVEVTSTGSKTFSVKIANTVAALKDTEVWLELEYMADSANPMTTNVIDAPVVSGTNSLDILAAGTNRTDTAEAWTGITGEITHTLSKTVTVNQIGWARARVCLAKASTTIYVDPQATVA